MNNTTKILDTFKELSYLLSMDNEGHLHKVIMEIDYVKNMYEEATLPRRQNASGEDDIYRKRNE